MYIFPQCLHGYIVPLLEWDKSTRPFPWLYPSSKLFKKVVLGYTFLMLPVRNRGKRLCKVGLIMKSANRVIYCLASERDEKVSSFSSPNERRQQRVEYPAPWGGKARAKRAQNASNAAVAFRRLGFDSAVVTDLGKDIGGKTCLDQLNQEGVRTDWITAHEGLPTNHHFVLWYDAERTILVRHTPYPYKLPALPDCAWMYLTSIGADSETYHKEIAAHLESHPDIKLVFQPGTFQIKMGLPKMAPFYKRAEVVAVNAT